MNAPLGPPTTELLGWLAAGLTLMTFTCQDMRRLRGLALCANAAFIAYGALAGLLPVMALHLLLVPVNLWRLVQALRPAKAEPPPRGRRPGGPRRPRPAIRSLNLRLREAGPSFSIAGAGTTMGLHTRSPPCPPLPTRPATTR